MKKHTIIFSVLTIMLGIMVASCNKNDKEEEDVQYYGTSVSSTLVSKFVLGSNEDVMHNLDSVFFTIDQDRKIIYNADSLPVGTNVRKLTVAVTFPYSVSSAQFHVTGGKLMKDTTITYTSETNDTIDFTGNVTLKVTSSDGNHVATYVVKVNVHQVEPDQLTFAQSMRRDLPNVNGTPQQVKTVLQGDTYLCLIKDGDKYVLSGTPTLGVGTWSKTELNVPFLPVVNSLTATSDALYMLDSTGELYSSTDQGTTWADCQQQWVSIVGGYGEKVLGVMQEDGVFKHDEYPRASNFTPVAIGDDFPVSGATPLVTGSNEWTSSEQVVMVGGVLQDGSLTNASWGYDGHGWGRIDVRDNTILPAIADAVLIPYYTYDIDSTRLTVAVKLVTWLVMGGRLAGGTLNRTTYVSYNQGMSWIKGASTLQQPDYMPSFYGAQAFVQTEKMSGAQLAPSTVTKPITDWECPYVYIVGGYASGGSVLNNIWKGQLNRLTFKPLF